MTTSIEPSKATPPYVVGIVRNLAGRAGAERFDSLTLNSAGWMFVLFAFGGLALDAFTTAMGIRVWVANNGDGELANSGVFTTIQYFFTAMIAFAMSKLYWVLRYSMERLRALSHEASELSLASILLTFVGTVLYLVVIGFSSWSTFSFCAGVFDWGAGTSLAIKVTTVLASAVISFLSFCMGYYLPLIRFIILSSVNRDRR